MSDFRAGQREILRSIDLAILNTEGMILKTEGLQREELIWAITLLKQAHASIEGVLNDAQKTTLD